MNSIALHMQILFCAGLNNELRLTENAQTTARTDFFAVGAMAASGILEQPRGWTDEASQAVTTSTSAL